MSEQRLPRPAPDTSIPLPEGVPTSPPRIDVGIGFIYRDKTDGTEWILSALRSNYAVILRSGGDIRDRVSLDELAYGYEHTGCNHEQFCCRTHGTHAMPHRGCLMR